MQVFKAGHVHGATDEFGFKAIEGRVGPADCLATLAHQFGPDHNRLTFRSADSEHSLIDGQECRVVKEILNWPWRQLMTNPATAMFNSGRSARYAWRIVACLLFMVVLVSGPPDLARANERIKEIEGRESGDESPHSKLPVSLTSKSGESCKGGAALT